MTSEEMIAHIVQEVASGAVCSGEMGQECLYCNGPEGKYSKHEYAIEAGNYTERIFHDPDCIILLARKVLREQGTPLNVYDMTADFLYMKTPKAEQWKKGGGYSVSISKEMAIHDWSGPNTRNVKAKFIAVLPDQQEKPA